MRTGCLLFCGSILVCAGTLVARTQQSGTSDANAASPPPLTDGAAIFRERGCAQCHTIRGIGGTKGPDLSGVGRRLKKNGIDDQIVHGGGAMPAFGDALPPEEVQALVKYLHKCRDKSKPVKRADPSGNG